MLERLHPRYLIIRIVDFFDSSSTAAAGTLIDVFRWAALFAFLASALTWLFLKVNHPKEDSAGRQ